MPSMESIETPAWFLPLLIGGAAVVCVAAVVAAVCLIRHQRAKSSHNPYQDEADTSLQRFSGAPSAPDSQYDKIPQKVQSGYELGTMVPVEADPSDVYSDGKLLTLE